LTVKFDMVTTTGALRMNAAQALEVIKKLDNVTRGMNKIVYLVGWQGAGHDTIYPAWDVVCPKIKNAGDPDATTSLINLMNEAKAYHTKVSLHVNMLSAHNDGNSLWNIYVQKDLIGKQADGTYSIYGAGQTVNYYNEWNTLVPGDAAGRNYAQKRIGDLIAMLPPLKDSGTIHIDAFHQRVPKSGEIDYRVTPRQQAETQKKIIQYWHDNGIDVTAEFDTSYRVDNLVGWQPMAWHYRLNDELHVPANIDCGGNGGRPRFGVSFNPEGQFGDQTNLGTFIKEFCTTTLPWYFLNSVTRQSDDGTTASFSDGVRSNNPMSITQNGNSVRINDDLFIPALWRAEREIYAWSTAGYSSRTWLLPSNWAGATSVDVYTLSVNGIAPKQNIPVSSGAVTMSMSANEANVIRPH
jgi:hypothetical protein